MDPISQLIFLPLAGAIFVAILPKKWERATFWSGLVFMALTALLSLMVFLKFSPDSQGFQFEKIIPWIPQYGVTYYVGIDGISLVMVVLTTLLSIIALASAFQAIKERRKEFVISLLVLETAMIGTFAALDIFLFYVFWELMLIPMYILIGVFGGKRRIYATLKFFLYTMAGSVLMLLAILFVYGLHAKQFAPSTAITDLYNTNIPMGTQMWLFGAFALAFAIKIPVFPFHTWLPDAHVEAPTAGSVILAGVLLKMGAYGFIRLAIPLFPQGAVGFAPLLGTLGVIGIVYGAYVALAQEDMKKLVAYSSVSHMGFIVLGLASLKPLALGGAVFHMVAHGISTGALFLLVGMLYERRHTRMMVDYGGLAKITPRIAVVFLIITLASIGLPGLCGFVGEFLILVGSFHALDLGHPAWMVGFAVTGIILGAAYMLLLYQKVFLGKSRSPENDHLRDLSLREGLVLALPVIFAVWLGLQPNVVLKRVEPSIERVWSHVSEKVKLVQAGNVPGEFQ